MNEYVRTSDMIEVIEVFLPFFAFCLFVCICVVTWFLFNFVLFVIDIFSTKKV